MCVCVCACVRACVRVCVRCWFLLLLLLCCCVVVVVVLLCLLLFLLFLFSFVCVRACVRACVRGVFVFVILFCFACCFTGCCCCWWWWCCCWVFVFILIEFSQFRPSVLNMTAWKHNREEEEEDQSCTFIIHLTTLLVLVNYILNKGKTFSINAQIDPIHLYLQTSNTEQQKDNNPDTEPRHRAIVLRNHNRNGRTVIDFLGPVCVDVQTTVSLWPSSTSKRYWQLIARLFVLGCAVYWFY